MEKVINQLFEIENKANQIIENANAQKNVLYEENENCILQMESEIAAHNTAKINALMAQAELELEKERQALLQNSEKQLKDLDDNFKKNHDVIVKKVFDSIIQI
jgi:translation elongation factor EF-1alpha